MDAYESLRAQIEAHIETHGVEEARLRAEIDALRARAEAAEKRADAAEAVMRGLLAVYDGEVRRQKAAIAEAAEARAAQAEADARLMAGLAFVSFVERTSFSTEIVEASLLDALDAAGDHAAAVSDADLIAAVRRILAAGGAA